MIINTDDKRGLPQALIRSVQIYLILIIPALLVIGSVRLVMTPFFLQFEYQRVDFPIDRYGFTLEDRLEYGPYGIEYILNGEDISFLGDLRLPADSCYPRPARGVEDCPMFNERELIHMEDVKIVATGTFLFGVTNALLAALAVILLWRHRRYTLGQALQQGSLLTIGLIAGIVVSAVVAWDFFFNTFHALFFEEGTWRFYFSDTLIRLYPERFWFDASVTAGLLTVVSASLIFYVGRRLKRSEQPATN